MPLPEESAKALKELAETSGDFTLMGIFVNPITSEMGTFSSHGFEPGKILGFLQNAVTTMVSAAANGELEYVNGTEEAGTSSEGAYLVH